MNLSMAWTAVIPLKAEGERKTRLAERLSGPERTRLSRRLFDHVAAVLARTPGISRVVVLSAAPLPDWGGDWVADLGRGLNSELAAARDRLSQGPFLIIHADLPLLAPDEVRVLLEAAEQSGMALAPDRHGGGTNALAVWDGRPLAFCFGPGSFAQHLAQARDEVAVVERLGLALDLDTPDDLDTAITAGFSPGHSEGEGPVRTWATANRSA